VIGSDVDAASIEAARSVGDLARDAVEQHVQSPSVLLPRIGVDTPGELICANVNSVVVGFVVGFLVGLFSEELPSEAAADFVEFVDGAGGAWGAAVVVAVGVAVVGVAFGFGVELVGGAAVGVGVDVVDVAVVGGYVAAALVLAVAVADFDGSSESAGEGASV